VKEDKYNMESRCSLLKQDNFAVSLKGKFIIYVGLAMESVGLGYKPFRDALYKRINNITWLLILLPMN
jgi:hypothetical protein